MALDERALAAFKATGILSLGVILSDAEIEHYSRLFDRDRRDMAHHWYPLGKHQTINCDVLVTAPGFDSMIRHPRALPAIAELMGGDVCFSEISIRHMAAHGGDPTRNWHRDRPHWPQHPYRMDYVQLIVYLTDVDESTHCFSISPESVGDEILDAKAQVARNGIVDLHGPAGSAALFNVAVLHTATVRSTIAERKSVQIYYGHSRRPFLSEDSVMPPAFWRDHEDAEVRAFYGVLNGKTQEFLNRTSGRDDIPQNEIRDILIDLDVQRGKREPPAG